MCGQKTNLLNFFQTKEAIESEANKKKIGEGEEEEDDDDDDSGSDEEDCCEAREECKIGESEEDTLRWVQCRTCDGWWHLFCLNLEKSPRKFKCDKC